MSIEDDVALLERVPTLRLLGTPALRMLAIGSEQRDVARGDALFNAGDDADAGFVVQRGAFRIEDGGGAGGQASYAQSDRIVETVDRRCGNRIGFAPALCECL